MQTTFRELIAANKQMEAFIYSIAHDLRAPLRSMQSFSTMLLEEAGRTGVLRIDAGHPASRRDTP